MEIEPVLIVFNFLFKKKKKLGYRIQLLPPQVPQEPSKAQPLVDYMSANTSFKIHFRLEMTSFHPPPLSFTFLSLQTFSCSLIFSFISENVLYLYAYPCIMFYFQCALSFILILVSFNASPLPFRLYLEIMSTYNNNSGREGTSRTSKLFYFFFLGGG